MATMIFQGVRTCHESPLAESRALRLRFSAKPHFSQPLELALKPCFLDSNIKELSEKYHDENSQKANLLQDKRTTSIPDSGGLSFLHILSNCSQCPKEQIDKENTYVHPLAKRSSSKLSEKSLQLCTENLGSETGTDITESSILPLSYSDLNFLAVKDGNSPTREQYKSRQLLSAEKANTRSFPPPLTTMTCGSEIQVRPHREDGRLIIKATKAPSRHTYFHAERSNGRLRLSFVKDSCDDLDGPNFATAQENEEKTENDMNNYDPAQEEEEEDEEDLEEGNTEACGEEDDGDDVGFGPELGLEEIQRPSRCKEEGELENKVLLNWELLWVATS